jgi:hypothetical protein
MMKDIGNREATCSESWRHSVATLRQDATVDPRIRPQVMGPRPTASPGLGMASKDTHTQHETLRQEVAQARWRCPESLR